jgi:hypothetical protein
VTPAREEILMEAEQWAVRLRRAGYTEVEVAPQYCIGNSIDGGLFTRTICLSVGPRVEKPKRFNLLARFKLWWNT